MQVNKIDDRKWNTILNLVLSSLGLVKHVVDHAIYILRTTSTKDVLIVGFSTNTFLCDYFIIHLFKELLAGINKCFPVTSKEGPQISYINIYIIQSPNVISINQTGHIQDTILAQ